MERIGTEPAARQRRLRVGHALVLVRNPWRRIRKPFNSFLPVNATYTLLDTVRVYPTLNFFQKKDRRHPERPRCRCASPSRSALVIQNRIDQLAALADTSLKCWSGSMTRLYMPRK